MTATIVGPLESLAFLITAGAVITFLAMIPTSRRGWRELTLKKWCVLGSLGTISLAGVGFFVVMLFFLYRHSDPRPNRADQLLSFFNYRITIYQIENGTLPTGTDSEILAELSQLEVTFKGFPGREFTTSKEGIPLDPWGTPIRFAHISKDRLTTYSAGPDREFSTEDDHPEKLDPAWLQGNANPNAGRD